MWNPDKNLTPQELEVMREYEYLYFKYNPGFRAMWNDNFEEYFKGTLDEEYWERRERERIKELEANERQMMMADPEYASWRHELAVIEETLFGDPNESYIARSRWFEREQMEKEAEERMARHDRKLKSDQLYKLAKSWSMKVLETGSAAYEKSRNINWFRIISNCLTVSGKIVFASSDIGEDLAEEVYGTPEDFLWRTDRIGYILSLASLQRCLDSFRKLQALDSELKIESFVSDALIIQKELIDRLDCIDQKYIKLLK